MARKSTQPLTPDEAKRQLREVASHTGLGNWVRHRPLEALTVGMATGLLMGSRARPHAVALGLAKRFARMLFW